MSQAARKDTPEQAEFRQYCRDWLQDNLPPDPPVRLPLSPLEIMTRDQLDYLQDWQKAAYDAGLVGCDYPIEYGGGGRQDCQAIANAEMSAVKTPFLPNVIGLGMAAPTVFYHARDEKKREWLPKLFSGEEIWCQGFSEPGAGSDLASVQTFAERDGDKWRHQQHYNKVAQAGTVTVHKRPQHQGRNDKNGGKFCCQGHPPEQGQYNRKARLLASAPKGAHAHKPQQHQGQLGRAEMCVAEQARHKKKACRAA